MSNSSSNNNSQDQLEAKRRAELEESAKLAAERASKPTNNKEDTNTLKIKGETLRPKSEVEKEIKTKREVKEEKGIAADNAGEVNRSRGIIGYKSSYVTPGTVADVVNPPSIFPNKDGSVNPVTEKDLKLRIEDERQRAGMDLALQEQIAIKARTEAQGFDYKPAKEFEGILGLEPTPSRVQQKKETKANVSKGEKVIDMAAADDDSNNKKGQ
jgi:hypothetical protein